MCIRYWPFVSGRSQPADQKLRRMRVRTRRILRTAVCASAIVTAQLWAGTSGSDHDFSSQAWNTTGELCIPCHTPHNGLSQLVPLWNHATTQVTTFVPYASPTLDATVGQPAAASKACLSCHDGTVALDSFSGNTSGTSFIEGGANFGSDLSNDHPISFAYDTALATSDGELSDPATTTVAALGGQTIDSGMLIGGQLECASCHDVHVNKGDATGTNAMLIVDNAGSALCLTCHDK